MIEELRERLDQLQQEYVAGEAQLGELVRREGELRETMLRISGAIQVLRELIDAGDRRPAPSAPPVRAADPNRPTPSPAHANGAPDPGTVLTVP